MSVDTWTSVVILAHFVILASFQELERETLELLGPTTSNDGRVNYSPGSSVPLCPISKAMSTG
jgi:hypothetical protein